MAAARLAIITRTKLRWNTHALAPTLEGGVLPSNGGGTRVLPMPIIGRDVLDTCVFRYNGPAQTLEFDSSPSGSKRKSPG